MVYNTPWEGFDMSLDLVDQLAKLPRCAALKWSTNAGVLAYQRGVARFSDRMAVVDNQGLHIVNHLLGGTGYVTHLATVWPEAELSIWRQLEAQDYRGAQHRIMETVWPWLEIHGELWKVTGAESPTVKAALDLCGRPGGPSRLTSRAATDAEREALREVLRGIGVPNLR
jgi:dihydrodipicolinate synthase/N-acetylneuraminate lyase